MQETNISTDSHTEEDLRGTLAHTSLVDLLQMLNAGNRTGVLEIRSNGQPEKANVYLSQGRLSHAVIGTQVGIDALAELLGWRDGAFRFSPNVVCPTISVEDSFQAAVMEAARRLDELTSVDDSQRIERIRREFRDFLAANDYATHAYLIDPDGCVDVSEMDRDQVHPWVDNLPKTVVQMIADHPRRQVNRMIIDDADGTLIVSCLTDGSVLLVAAKKTATLGAVVIGSDRLARIIRNLNHNQ